MRLLFLLSNRPGQGTYWRALPLGQELARRGHHVTLVVTSAAQRRRFGETKSGGVLQVEAPDLLPGALRSGWDVWACLARINWTRRRTFDLVHAFESRPVVIAPALYLRRRRQIPLVMDWCDWFGRGGSVEERPQRWVRALLRPVETFFEERFRTCADGTTVINTILRQKAIELGVPEGRILLLPNGFDTSATQPVEPAQARRALGLPADAPILLYLGVIFRRDAELMARAFDRIHAARPDVRLLLVGCNIDVQGLVKEPQAVIAVPQVPRSTAASYVAASDVCWLPFRNSGANRGRFPVKLGEFLLAGKPVVATDVGDVGELLRSESAGLVVPDVPEALARGVLALLAQPAERDRLAHRARQVVRERFELTSVVDRLEAFYCQVLEWAA